MGTYQIKYRPKKIEELDSLSVRKQLISLLSCENKPQAWLFAGPRGTGKTSAARILAKHVNCLALKGIEPCGRCEACVQIESGAEVDVIEMDAASNRGIDDVRVLKDNIHLAPIAFKTKVFIIDEVHMMTKEAFNALLKVLEEPPAHVVFVLCTTNPEKIPVTVLSRLTRVDFPKGKEEEVLSSLKKVIKGEKLTVEDGVLERLAQMVDGSFRDAHKTLLILMAESKGVLNKKILEKFLEKSGLGKEGAFLELLSEGRRKELFLMVEEMANLGIDLFEFRQNLLKSLQEELLFRMAGIGEGQGLKMKDKEVIDLINCLLEAADGEKRSVLSQLPLELAILKYMDNRSVADSPIKIQQLVKKDPVKAGDDKIDIGRKARGGVRVEKICELWSEILLAVRPHNHSVEAFLRSSRPLSVEGDKLVLEVFYQFHKDRLEDERNRVVVERALFSVLGQEYRVFFKLGEISSVKNNDFPKREEEKGKNDDLYEVAKELFG